MYSPLHLALATNRQGHLSDIKSNYILWECKQTSTSLYTGKLLTHGLLHSILLHDEQCGSCREICAWFVSSGRQSSAPVAVLFSATDYSAVCYIMVQYSLGKCVFLYETHMKYEYARKCWQNFNVNFMMKEFPAAKQFTIWWIGHRNRWQEIKKNKCQLLMEEELGDTGARLECTPIKSPKHLAQETGVPKLHAWRATQFLKLKLHKTAVINAVQPAGSFK
jgi:hypothetical protein